MYNLKVEFTFYAMVQGKGKHLRKTEEKQVLQERRSVLQKHGKNGLAK